MIVIIDYGMGNLGSIANMLKKIGAEAVISSDHEVIQSADKLILPGVGAFDNGMRNLDQRGLIPILNEKVLHKKTPILGLCLGMQLFSEKSEEGKLHGLGWIKAETVRFHFTQNNSQLKVPHMGWNVVKPCYPHPIFQGMDEESRFYFVHSYHLVCSEGKDILALTDYGYEFPSGVAVNNIIGLQCHPEKSHKFGMMFLKNFAELA